MEELTMRHDDMNWRTIDSEYVVQRPWLTVRRERVQLPDGREHPEYYILEYPTWVNVIATTEDGDFVMIRQYRHGLGETRYEMVAGCVEEGETPEEAARRELREEAGYEGGRWSEFAVLSANPATSNNLVYTFLAEGVVKTATQSLDAAEDIELHILTCEQLLDLLRNDEIRQALMAASLWKYFYMNLKP